MRGTKLEGYCGKCGDEIYDCDPMEILRSPDGQKDGAYLCYTCCFIVAQEAIKLNLGGWGFLWLEGIKYLFKNNFNRRSTYLPRKLKNKVFRKYKHECQECGEKDQHKLSIDHKMPVLLGGKDDIKNLQVLCRSCNSKKGTKCQTE